MMKNDDLVRVVLIVGLAVVWGLAVVPGSIDFVDRWVASIDGQPSALWMQEVSAWSRYVVFVALAVTLGWYGYGVSQRIGQWSGVNHRLAWNLCLLVTVCMVAYAGFSLTTVAQGTEVVWGVYAFHGCGLYYVASVLASPTRWKYTPPLAVYFRKL